MADEPLVALVTGGSRGVGAATAQALARAGFRVTITYRNKRERAGEVVEHVRQEEGQATALSYDITRRGVTAVPGQVISAITGIKASRRQTRRASSHL